MTTSRRECQLLVKLDVSGAKARHKPSGLGSATVLPFTRSFVNQADRLPEASACDSVLRMPVTFSKKSMREVVLSALNEGLAAAFQLR